MPQAHIVTSVRHSSPAISIINIQGEVTMLAEQRLMEAYAEAALPTTRSILLHCSGMSYLNSGGIGLLIVLLRHAYRRNQRLLCCG